MPETRAAYRILLLLCGLLRGSAVRGQDFLRYYSDSAELQTAFSIHRDSLGFVWMGGNRLKTGAEWLQAWLYRLNPDGTIRNRFYFPQAGYQTWTGIAEPEAGLLVAAYAQQNTSGITENYLVRIDSTAITNIRLIPGLSNAIVDDVSAFDHRTVLICGFRGGPGTQGNNLFIARVDIDSAAPRWIYEEDITPNDHIRKAIRSKDKGVLACGDISQQSYNPYVLKLDSNGNFLWDRSLESNWNDGSQDIVQEENGNIWLAGESSTSAGPQFDTQISCLSESGEPLWQKWWGGPGQDAAFHLRKKTEGGFWVGGYSNALGTGSPISPFLMKMNENGDSQGEAFWPLPSPSPVFDMMAEKDSVFFFCGVSGNRAFLMKRVEPPLSPVFVTARREPAPTPYSLPRPEPSSFRIVNALGRELFRGDGLPDPDILERFGSASGFYFLVLRYPGHSQTLRLSAKP
jgi:hypothetical protein